MANIKVQAQWENDVYELALTDDIIGGPDGIDNLPHKQLANRTAYLKSYIVPVGAIIIWPAETPPAGYLECDGSALSRTTYAALYAEIGTTYGKGAGALADTTFRLPDGRGEFIRGWDHGRGLDPDAANRTDRGDAAVGDKVGTKQAASLKSHEHIGLYNSPYSTGLHYIYGYKHDGVNTHANMGHGAFPRLGLGLHDNNAANAVKTGATGGKETRPRNIAMMFAIKY